MSITNQFIVPALQPVLYRRAIDLSRRLFVSMPWGFKVAQLLTVLAGDALDAFGRAAYGEMIKAVVRGMPDAPNGKAAYDYLGDVTSRGADALPSGYGRSFANRVYRILLSKFSDPEVAEEAMSRVMMQVVRGKVHIRSGADLADAESLIITIAMNAARDLLRAQSRRREGPLVREHNDNEAPLDIEDPEAFRRLDKLLPSSELRDVLRQLAEVHPRAPDWLQARLQGDSGQEIAREWQTTPSYVSKWQRAYLPQIRRVVELHLRNARQGYSYDRRTF